MAQIDMQNKNYDKCINRVSESLNIHPTSQGLFLRGCAYLELNELTEAEKDLDICIEMDPENSEAKVKILEVKRKLRQNQSSFIDKLKNLFV